MDAQFGPHHPITATEINKAFRNLLWKAGGGRNAFMRLGFAISGGVDSMALAYLWKQLRLNRPSYNPYVRGFVIDHGLRSGSAEEAQLVASRLEPLLGRPGHIITLNWNGYGDPDSITCLETTARKLRYRALAEAAHEHGIRCILLGHHADDNVETAISRMISKSTGSGLIGLKGLANIPECYGLYGINQSGGFNRLDCHSKDKHYVGGPEEGGLKIGRPLINFPKSRLIATCKKAGIEWVEDKTNQDVTFTPRNVVRSMLNTDVLPMALRRDSMLQTIQTIEEKSEQIQVLAKKFYDATLIKYLDLRSGAIMVYLPDETFIEGLLEEYQDEEIVSQGFAKYFHALAESVSPGQRLRIDRAKVTARILFNALTKGKGGRTIPQLSFSSVKIDFVKPMAVDGKRRIGIRLYRTPFIRAQKDINDLPRRIVLPSLKRSSRKQSLADSKSMENTHFWDGRWWISAQNYSSVPLRIEPVIESKMEYFRSTMFRAGWKSNFRLLKEAAPGTSLWTMPAIVCDGPPPEESKISPSSQYYNPRNNLGGMQNRSHEIPKFEILKYPSGTVGPDEGKYSEKDSVRTFPVHNVDPDLFTLEDNLAKLPQSTKNLSPTPQVPPKGTINIDEYPVPKEGFIVALPTLGLFVNRYWFDHLRYDIRYKNIPLTDMSYVSQHRMEKPIIIDGQRTDAVQPTMVGQRLPGMETV